MNVITRPDSTEAAALRAALLGQVGRYRDKTFDFDAFPANRGYPLLARGQMRFVGAGGSPKVGDSTTLPPKSFTVSLIHQQPGCFAAAHKHEIEEAFFVFHGVLTVGWEQGGEAVEVRLGRKDMIMNALDLAHGFRNDDVEPVLMSVMVGVGKPLPPVYTAHPRDVPEEAALRFGASTTRRFDPASEHPLMRKMAGNLVRYADLEWRADGAGFRRATYVGPGGIASAQNRKEMVGLPPGAGVKPYARPVEDAYFVTEGLLTVGWEENGVVAETRIGPRELLLTPPGRPHWFRNEGLAAAEFLMIVGEAGPDGCAFRAA